MIDRKTPLVSVIVPVYNAGKYIGRCIDSILNQTIMDFELILVDDGSTDNSALICEEYSQKDNRIVVVHKKNGGTSDARNKGLDIARGEFIMFCDNDDVVAYNWIETLYKYAVKYPNSLVNCEYAKINMKTGETTEIYLPNVDESLFFSKDEYYFLYSNAYILYIWNRIYRLETIKNKKIRFDTSMKKGGEDILFNLSYIDTCKNFFHIHKCLYFWVDNGSSVSRNYEAHYYSVIKDLYFPRLKLISAKYQQNFYDEYFYRFYNCIEICEDSRNKESKKDRAKYCNYILRDEEFIHALNNASEQACSKRLKTVLKFRSYKILKVFQKICNVKKS